MVSNLKCDCNNCTSCTYYGNIGGSEYTTHLHFVSHQRSPNNGGEFVMVNSNADIDSQQICRIRMQFVRLIDSSGQKIDPLDVMLHHIKTIVLPNNYSKKNICDEIIKETKYMFNSNIDLDNCLKYLGI